MDHHLSGLRAKASSEELYGNIRKSKTDMDRLMTNIIVTFMKLVVVAF